VDAVKPNGWGEQVSPKVIADLKTMLGGGLTFKDNMNAAIVTVDCQHNTETRVTNPLITKPIAFIPISSVAITAFGGQTSNVARPIDGLPVLNTSRTDGFLGLTVQYAGTPGESLSAFVPVSSKVGLSTGAGANVTSITVPAGEWDVRGLGVFGVGSGAAPTGTNIALGISVTSATMPVGALSGLQYDEASAMPSGTSNQSLALPGFPISVTSATAYYLVAQSAFSAGTIAAWGSITATRRKIDPATLGRVTGILVGA
jgi:hypothetical protein